MPPISRSDLQQESIALIDQMKRARRACEASRHRSEEGEVWALFDQHGNKSWLKGHLTEEKANREVEVYRLLQSMPDRGQIPSATLIRRLGPHHLLLTDLRGTSFKELPHLDAAHREALVGALPRALCALHTLPFVPPPDPLPLRHALPRRWRSSCAEVSDFMSDLALNHDIERSTLTRALNELNALADELDQGERLSSLMLERSLCHRDLNPENLIFTQVGEVGLIDFGQARADWWGSDWVTLWPHLSDVGLFSEALNGYLRRYGTVDRAGVRELLRVATLSRALSTIRWGRRHRLEPVIQRGRAELSAVLSSWDQGEAW